MSDADLRKLAAANVAKNPDTQYASASDVMRMELAELNKLRSQRVR
jgi:hypothetical protein